MEGGGGLNRIQPIARKLNCSHLNNHTTGNQVTIPMHADNRSAKSEIVIGVVRLACAGLLLEIAHLFCPDERKNVYQQTNIYSAAPDFGNSDQNGNCYF